ncbi:MAG TPA: alpha/beta hydrolase [Burkholderiaceae bacterium]|nr:alpha/beta hydrolase [Burkholderiaceae bacterium]
MQPRIQFAEIEWAGRRVRIEHQRLTPQGEPAREALRVARTNAPLLVFLHEGLGSLAMWREFPQRLCNALGWPGLVYSRPGYGRSTPRGAGERWGLDFMHRQAYEVLPALLDALQIDRSDHSPWLFGHSDGASIALLHAARYPRQVGGLVVLAPHLFVEPVSVASIQRARANYQHTDLKQRLARYHDDPDSAFWGWNDIWLQAPFARWNIEAEIAPIACPLLALQGVDDEYGTLEQIHAIARHLPHAALIELADCGHSPQRDQPERVIDETVRFAAAHAAREPTTPQHQPTA